MGTDFPLSNLRCLEWDFPGLLKPKLQPIVPFMAPSLAELRIDVASESTLPENAKLVEYLLDALKTIESHRLTLTSFELIMIGPSILSAEPALLNTIGASRYLEKISLSTNTIQSPGALQILSQLPHLSKLRIVDGHGHARKRVSCEALSSGFRALNTLELNLPYQFADSILRIMPSCSLRRCAITITTHCPHSVQEALINSIVRNFSRYLEVLYLFFREDAFDDYRSYVPVSTKLLPVLRSLDPVEVHIRWIAAEEVTDTLCRDLARSWPRLRVLHLSPKDAVLSPPETMATLHALRHFSENCPELAEITIQLNAAGDHWAEAALEMQHKRLSEPISLDLTTSLVTSPPAVAAYLQRCFSSFRGLQFTDSDASFIGENSRTIAWRELCDLFFPEYEE